MDPSNRHTQYFVLLRPVVYVVPCMFCVVLLLFLQGCLTKFLERSAGAVPPEVEGRPGWAASRTRRRLTEESEHTEEDGIAAMPSPLRALSSFVSLFRPSLPPASGS